MNDKRWHVGNLAIHGYVIYAEDGQEIVTNIYHKEIAAQIVREHNAVLSAIRNSENWILEDWQGWLKYRALPQETSTTTERG